ncbi:MAG: AI-2E family transporter [Patescibacteria group bacterium]
MNPRISSYFFFILLLGTVVAAVMIFLPFLTPILLAAVGAVIAYPIYKRINRLLGRGSLRDSLAAFITVILILIVILAPLFFLVGSIYAEVQTLYGTLTDESGRSDIISSLNSISATLSHSLFDVFPAYAFDSLNVTEYVKRILEWMFTNLDTIFGSMAKVIGYVFVFLLSMFYFLRDGDSFKQKFISWSPLLDTYDEYITTTLKKAVWSVIAGTLTVSIIQGALTGLGFFIFGIPAPAVWGSVAAVASLIPGLGTSLVIIPGAIYLLVTGNYLFAIGLTVWGVFAVGLIDNFLGPYLINKGVNAHPFLILVSVLGGIATFGPIGFILGPLILAFLFALLDIYRKTWHS